MLQGVTCPKFAIFAPADSLQTLCLASVMHVFWHYDAGCLLIADLRIKSSQTRPYGPTGKCCRSGASECTRALDHALRLELRDDHMVLLAGLVSRGSASRSSRALAQHRACAALNGSCQQWPVYSVHRDMVTQVRKLPQKSPKPKPLQRRRRAKHHATKTRARVESTITQLTNTVGEGHLFNAYKL